MCMLNKSSAMRKYRSKIGGADEIDNNGVASAVITPTGRFINETSQKHAFGRTRFAASRRRISFRHKKTR